MEAKNDNALLCFDHGALVDNPEKNWGHVCVFDRVVDSKIRIVDPSPDQPRWRLVEPAKLLDAMQKHGAEKSAGVWIFETVNNYV